MPWPELPLAKRSANNVAMRRTGQSAIAGIAEIFTSATLAIGEIAGEVELLPVLCNGEKMPAGR